MAAQGAFHRLGKAVDFGLAVGKEPDSLIFKVQIEPGPGGEPYTIEYFALPDMAMALLQMLAEAAQHENYRIPAGSITRTPFQ